MNKSTEISRKAADIAGAIWSDRDRTGTLADQLEVAASWPNMGTDGDLTDADRSALRELAKEATAESIRDAGSLTYDPSEDKLYADGVLVGGASDLTREMMLARLSEPESHGDASDETLFDLVVTAAA